MLYRGKNKALYIVGKLLKLILTAEYAYCSIGDIPKVQDIHSILFILHLLSSKADSVGLHNFEDTYHEELILQYKGEI